MENNFPLPRQREVLSSVCRWLRSIYAQAAGEEAAGRYTAADAYRRNAESDERKDLALLMAAAGWRLPSAVRPAIEGWPA